MRRDLVDHRDIFVLFLFQGNNTYNLMNVYSDDDNTVILYLRDHVDELPLFQYMGGDFNVHSRVWDSNVTHHRWAAITLLEIAADLDLEWTQPSNPGPTFISHNEDLRPSVIDLMFHQISDSARSQTNRDPDRKGPTDHIPLTTSVILDSVIEGVTRRSITRGSEAEKAFINDLRTGVLATTVGTLNTSADIDRVAQALADVFSMAWDKHCKEVCITKHSQPWWDDECTESLSQYKTEKSEESWLAFRRTVKAAKRKFFDSRIEDIALSNKRPWDLMEWVKQRKLPACETIQYKGQSCHEMDDLWNALHNTYNSASGREVDLSVLDPLPTLQERDWPPFSALELTDALASCSSRSSPGPDHITWVHLKVVLESQKARFLRSFSDGLPYTI